MTAHDPPTAPDPAFVPPHRPPAGAMAERTAPAIAVLPSWTELRASALVGTGRRPLAPAAIPAQAAPPEVRALQAAALLGAARRAGLVAGTGPAPAPPPTPLRPGPGEPVPGAQAVQLLELLLGSNLGRAHEVQSLIGHWLDLAARAGLVLPHHLLVTLLERATAERTLRAAVAPVLGARGRWLAERHPEWTWAAPAEVQPPGPAGPADEPDGFLALSPDQRAAALLTLRQHRPAAGLALLHLVWPRLDASARAALLPGLRTGLNPEDEPLLERALDDRSRPVRAAAIALLDGLPGSARAARCAGWLAPLIERRNTGVLSGLRGRSRSQLAVTYPAPPAGEQLRDLPPAEPGRNLTTEAHWLRTLVAGAPLAWWEATLGDTPRVIVARTPEAQTDLVAGWQRAAVAEHHVAWAEALLDEGRVTHQLLTVAGPQVAPALVGRILAREAPIHERVQLIHALARPWSPALATEVLGWLRQLPNPDFVVSMVSATLSEALPADAVTFLQAWLDRVDRADSPALHRSLRHVIQLLSTRLSITEALT